MAKKNITINDLAIMVQKGFDGADKHFEKTATVEQLDSLKKWAEGRFNRIEKLLIEEQNRKIEKLESRIEYLENMLNLPAKN